MGQTYSSNSYDVDNPSAGGEYGYVSQTDYRSDGSVHQYDSKDGDWSKGHGHSSYNSGKDHALGNANSNSRSVNDSRSSGRSWTNRRIIFERLFELSFEELQYVEAISTNDYIKRSARHLMYNATSEELILGPTLKLTR